MNQDNNNYMLNKTNDNVASNQTNYSTNNFVSNDFNGIENEKFSNKQIPINYENTNYHKIIDDNNLPSNLIDGTPTRLKFNSYIEVLHELNNNLNKQRTAINEIIQNNDIDVNIDILNNELERLEFEWNQIHSYKRVTIDIFEKIATVVNEDFKEIEKDKQNILTWFKEQLNFVKKNQSNFYIDDKKHREEIKLIIDQIKSIDKKLFLNQQKLDILVGQLNHDNNYQNYQVNNNQKVNDQYQFDDIEKIRNECDELLRTKEILEIKLEQINQNYLINLGSFVDEENSSNSIIIDYHNRLQFRYTKLLNHCNALLQLLDDLSNINQDSEIYDIWINIISYIKTCDIEATNLILSMSINPDNGYLIDPVYKNITINKNNSVIKKIEEFRYSLFLEEQALRLIQKECIFKTNGLIWKIKEKLNEIYNFITKLDEDKQNINYKLDDAIFDKTVLSNVSMDNKQMDINRNTILDNSNDVDIYNNLSQNGYDYFLKKNNVVNDTTIKTQKTNNNKNNLNIYSKSLKKIEKFLDDNYGETVSILIDLNKHKNYFTDENKFKQYFQKLVEIQNRIENYKKIIENEKKIDFSSILNIQTDIINVNLELQNYYSSINKFISSKNLENNESNLNDIQKITQNNNFLQNINSNQSSKIDDEVLKELEKEYDKFDEQKKDQINYFRNQSLELDEYKKYLDLKSKDLQEKEDRLNQLKNSKSITDKKYDDEFNLLGKERKKLIHYKTELENYKNIVIERLNKFKNQLNLEKQKVNYQKRVLRDISVKQKNNIKKLKIALVELSKKANAIEEKNKNLLAEKKIINQYFPFLDKVDSSKLTLDEKERLYYLFAKKYNKDIATLNKYKEALKSSSLITDKKHDDQNNLIKQERKKLMLFEEEFKRYQKNVVNYLKKFKKQLDIERQKVDYEKRMLKNVSVEQKNNIKQLENAFVKLDEKKNEFENVRKIELEKINDKYKNIENRENELNKKANEIEEKNKRLLEEKARINKYYNEYERLKDSLIDEQQKFQDVNNSRLKKLNNFNAELEQKKHKLKSFFEKIKSTKLEQDKKQSEYDLLMQKYNADVETLNKLKDELTEKENEIEEKNKRLLEEKARINKYYDEYERLKDSLIDEQQKFQDVNNSRLKKLNNFSAELEQKKHKLKSFFEKIKSTKLEQDKKQSEYDLLMQKYNADVETLNKLKDELTEKEKKFLEQSENEKLRLEEFRKILLARELNINKIINKIKIANEKIKIRSIELKAEKEKIESLYEKGKINQDGRNFYKGRNCNRLGVKQMNNFDNDFDNFECTCHHNNSTNDLKDSATSLPFDNSSFGNFGWFNSPQNNISILMQMQQLVQQQQLQMMKYQYRMELKQANQRNVELEKKINELLALQSQNKSFVDNVNSYKYEEENNNHMHDNEKEQIFQDMINEIREEFSNELDSIKRDKDKLVVKLSEIKNYLQEQKKYAMQEKYAEKLLNETKRLLSEERQRYAQERKRIFNDSLNKEVLNNEQQNLNRINDYDDKKRQIQILNEQIKNVKKILDE